MTRVKTLSLTSNFLKVQKYLQAEFNLQMQQNSD